MAIEIYLKCDKCGTREFFPDVIDRDIALIMAEKLGWDVFTRKEDGTFDDLCPECKKKECNNVE